MNVEQSVDPCCIFVPLEVSGLALNFREKFASFIKFFQIYVMQLSCSLKKDIGMENKSQEEAPLKKKNAGVLL